MHHFLNFFVFFLHNFTDYLTLRCSRSTNLNFQAMKKIFSFAIVLAAVAMVSCGGNTTKPAAAAEEPATEVAAEATDAEGACCGDCEKADSTECCCGGEKAEGACCNE